MENDEKEKMEADAVEARFAEIFMDKTAELEEPPSGKHFTEEQCS